MPLVVAAARARGKQAVGMVSWIAAVSAANNGTITGSGPADRGARQRLLETGWRPYSFVTTDENGVKTYTEYKRADPWAMFLGVAADIVDISGSMDEATANELAMAGMTAVVNNLGNKAYMTGMQNLVEAIGEPERRLQSLINSYGSSMVPYSSFMRDMRKNGDPMMREVEGLVDAVKNTIPGFQEPTSETLVGHRGAYHLPERVGCRHGVPAW